MTNQILGACILGLIYGIMVLGVYISFRILKVPDLTVDGSIVLGMSTGTVFVKMGHPLGAILAGILTMTGLYSVCLQLQGGSPNISLLGDRTIFSVFLEAHGDMNKNIARMIVALIAAVIMLALTILFFKTRLGLCIRTDRKSVV